MVQILPSNRGPSVGERLSQGIGRGLEMGSQMIQEHQQQQMQEQQKKYIEQLFGPEIANFPPELQKAVVVEALKQQGKEKLLGQKGELLGEVFSRGKQPSFGEQISQEHPQQMEQQFDPSKISDEDIARATSLDPAIGRELRSGKDTALREKRAEREFEYKKEQTSPEKQREKRVSTAQADADVKYNQSLQEASKQHELKEQTLDRLDKLNQKGVTGKPIEKLFEKAGLVNLTSEGRREFAADVKNLITDIRSILGAQFTGFEFQTILNAYPSADFSKEANTAIIKNLKDFQEIKKKEVQFAEQLKKENGGKIPEDFQSKVNEKVREYAASKLPEIKANTQKILAEEYGITKGNVLMLDPNGEPLDVSPDDVQKYEALGATLP